MDVENISRRLNKEINLKYNNIKSTLERLTLKLEQKSPKNIIVQKKNELNNIDIRLKNLIGNKVDRYRHNLNVMAEKLNGRSPLLRLKSGYSFVSKDGAVVKSVKNINIEDELHIDVADGRIKAKVVDKDIVKRC